MRVASPSELSNVCMELDRRVLQSRAQKIGLPEKRKRVTSPCRGRGKSMRRLLAAAIILCSISGNATAVPILAPNPLNVAGRLATCGPYPIYLDHDLSDVGVAQWNGLAGKLTLNPGLMASRTPAVQWLIFAHECGHLMTQSGEAAADCWAVKAGRDQGWFGAWNFQDLMDELGSNPGTMSHPPGTVRIQHMITCFQQP